MAATRSSVAPKTSFFGYLPDATHVLVKPRERYLSQQGNVNWFAYWLLGKEARDAENEADFQRWEKLKAK